jgi:hypothetical protein
MTFAKATRRKKMLCAVLIAGVYLSLPFFSGVFSYYDPRGPLIYPMKFHVISHRIGWALIRSGKARIPFRAERSFFYQLDGFKEETFN